MKKVIFVCLLSLSVCLSQPSAPTEAAAQTPAVTPPRANATETKVAETIPDLPQEAAAVNSTKPMVVPLLAGQNATATTNVTQASNETSTKTNDTKPAEKTNSTDVKPSTNAPAKPVEPPAKEKNETKPAVPVVPANGTNADSKDNKKNETTTPKGENVIPTAVPIQAKSRAFDGPSFIGGIILTLGLLAIGFMGFKYYKNQTERNYHTL